MTIESLIVWPMLLAVPRQSFASVTKLLCALPRSRSRSACWLTALQPKITTKPEHTSAITPRAATEASKGRRQDPLSAEEVNGALTVTKLEVAH